MELHVCHLSVIDLQVPSFEACARILSVVITKVQGFSHYSCVLVAQAGMVGGTEYVMAVRPTVFIIAVTFCVSSQKC